VKAATKKTKKKKLESLPKIKRRLFRLWSEAVRQSADFSCEVCGIKRGEMTDKGSPTKIDAHHLVSRHIKDSPLKFDIRNGISVDPAHHKFLPEKSFHKAGLVMAEWLRLNMPDRYQFVLENIDRRVDLDNRHVLAKIEEKLKACEPLDFDELDRIAEENPRPCKVPDVGNIIDIVADETEEVHQPLNPDDDDDKLF